MTDIGEAVARTIKDPGDEFNESRTYVGRGDFDAYKFDAHPDDILMATFTRGDKVDDGRLLFNPEVAAALTEAFSSDKHKETELNYGVTMIQYRNIAKYKYELEEDYSINLKELDDPAIWAILRKDQKKSIFKYLYIQFEILTLMKGYACDGPSGPTVDTEDFMRGSFVHDALYQLIREGVLGKSFRKKADKILYRLCREDGMPWFRAQYVYRAVRWFGGTCV